MGQRLDGPPAFLATLAASDLARGEIQKPGGDRVGKLRSQAELTKPTSADLGSSRKDIHEARLIRDAEDWRRKSLTHRNSPVHRICDIGRCSLGSSRARQRAFSRKCGRTKTTLRKSRQRPPLCRSNARPAALLIGYTGGAAGCWVKTTRSDLRRLADEYDAVPNPADGGV